MPSEKGRGKGVNIQRCFTSPCPDIICWLPRALQPCACRQVAACHSPTDGHTTVSGPRQTACLLLGTLARLELLQPPGSVMPGARIGAFCLNTEKLSFHGLFPETLMKPGAQFQGPGICACGLLPLVFPSKPKCPQRAPLWSYC